MDDESVRLPRAWPILLVVWVPFSVALAIATTQFAGGSIRAGALSGAITGLLSFGFALVVWRVTSRIPWTGRPGVGFWAIHLAASLGYGLVWWVSTKFVVALVNGEPPVDAVAAWWHSEVVGWDLLVGLTVYGLVAGLSYTTRLQWKLEREKLFRARADAAARTAQLAALEARLDPHSVFNTLHSVAALVRRDPAGAEDAIDTLGELLRDTLQDDAGGSRPLADEWRFAEQFLELERLRLGDRLRVDVSLTPEAMAAKVPRLMLPSLVENAVRHGIGPRPAGGTVRIEARLAGTTLLLTVADDGVGARSSPELGLGLGVLRAQLAARRPPGTLTIRTGEGNGFAATVSVPEAAG